MTTINIPNRRLQVGTTEFGPTSIPDGAVFATIDIDRTVSGGLNSLTGATQLVLNVFESLDGGTTWINAASTTCIGGIFTMHGGVTVTDNNVGVMIYPDATNAKASIDVSGTSVTIAGSLTVQ